VNSKPKIKVAIKSKAAGAQTISLFAAWDNDGRLSASLDKRVLELAVKLDDGNIVRVKRGADGKPDHWINVYDNASSAPTRAAQPAPEVDGTDDLPF